MIAVATTASRFFSWWFGELAACLPDRVRRPLRRRPSVLVMTPSGGVAHFALHSGGQIKRRGQIPLCMASRGALLNLFSGAQSRSLEIVAAIPVDKVLRRNVSLPLEASENLREVLAFQMDRHTPFKASEVAYDYRVTGTDAALRRITVELAVVPRTTIEQTAAIADSFGLGVHRIGVAGDGLHDRDGSFNFRPHEDPVVPAPAQRRLMLALTTIAAILAVLAWYLPLYFDHRTLAAYEARLSAMRTQALEAEGMRKQLTTAVELSRVLVDRRTATPTVVSLLADITHRLPDDTWLTQVQLQGGTVTLTGFSLSAAPLIARLEVSPLLSHVRFGSPVTPDPELGAERFNIVAQTAPDRSS
jgi:general secretion pathway protein L